MMILFATSLSLVVILLYGYLYYTSKSSTSFLLLVTLVFISHFNRTSKKSAITLFLCGRNGPFIFPELCVSQNNIFFKLLSDILHFISHYGPSYLRCLLQLILSHTFLSLQSTLNAASLPNIVLVCLFFGLFVVPFRCLFVSLFVCLSVCQII